MILALALVSLVSFEARLALLDARLALRRHGVWDSERRSWQRIVAMNEARFAEGVVPERDLIQTRVEAGLLDLEVAETRRKLDAARGRLAKLLDVSESALPGLEVDAAQEDFPPLPNVALGPLGPGTDEAAREYESAREEIQTIRLRLLGSCEESVAIEELLYEQLKTTLLSVIEARRTCRDIRLRYEDALNHAETSRLRLQKLLGREDFLS